MTSNHYKKFCPRQKKGRRCELSRCQCDQHHLELRVKASLKATGKKTGFRREIQKALHSSVHTCLVCVESSIKSLTCLFSACQPTMAAENSSSQELPSFQDVLLATCGVPPPDNETGTPRPENQISASPQAAVIGDVLRRGYSEPNRFDFEDPREIKTLCQDLQWNGWLLVKNARSKHPTEMQIEDVANTYVRGNRFFAYANPPDNTAESPNKLHLWSSNLESQFVSKILQGLRCGTWSAIDYLEEPGSESMIESFADKPKVNSPVKLDCYHLGGDRSSEWILQTVYQTKDCLVVTPTDTVERVKGNGGDM